MREYQELTLKSRLKIPLIYGVDAVHGHNNIVCDEATFRKLHVAPYLPAIKAGSGSIMVS